MKNAAQAAARRALPSSSSILSDRRPSLGRGVPTRQVINETPHVKAEEAFRLSEFEARADAAASDARKEARRGIELVPLELRPQKDVGRDCHIDTGSQSEAV